MIVFKILYIADGNIVTDRFETRRLADPSTIAALIRQLYEATDVDVISIVQASEVDVDIF